jgi:transglutaminase-like putative cysteine protease
MRVRVGCQFVHRTEAPVHAVLQVEPRLDAGLGIVEERWENDPAVPMSRYVDGFGNLCRRITLPAGDSVLRYSALVELSGNPDPVSIFAGEVPPADLPDDTLTFTLPSRLCPSDELGSLAWELFGDVTPGWPRVQAVCNWVHNEISFGYGTSTSGSTAQDVLQARKGVCRDFAHLAVTFCRALNVPTRYTFGYLPDIGVPPPEDPMDFCAWMEVFLDGSWWTFDPRNNQRRVGRVLIGRGRDAVDVAMVTTYGPAELVSMEVVADEVVT